MLTYNNNLSTGKAPYHPFVRTWVQHFTTSGDTGVQWIIDPTFVAKDSIEFFLEASGSPRFDDLWFSKSGGDTYLIIDDSKLQQSFAPTLVYRVKLVTSGNVYYSPTLNYYAQEESKHLYAIAADIQRRELLRMQKFSGNSGWLLKRKSYSIQKSDNLDPVTGLPLSDTSIDAGTNAAVGYYGALPILYSREGSQQTIQASEQGFGTQMQEIGKLRMIGCPLVTEKDIIVTSFNHRYIVTAVEAKQLGGTNLIITQNLTCATLPITDPMYNWKL